MIVFAVNQPLHECLRDLGVPVISLPAEPDLPDSMFVEDPAVVVAEVAVMTRMGAESRHAGASGTGRSWRGDR